jgi:NADH:ubiquinone oxidoreductase subunit E
MNKQRKFVRPITGHFLGWGDSTIPHRYIRIATNSGEQLIKVAKSLRPQIQDWQPGMWLTLLSQQRIDVSTGETKIKVKQLLITPLIDVPQIGSESSAPASCPLEPTKIRVCQGSTCRRQGSAKICRSMEMYLDQHHLTAQVEIETVKCLHQCKAAPHAIITSPVGSILPGKTHYRQLQPIQIQTILAKHFPVAVTKKQIASTLIEKIGYYLKQHRISTLNNLS